MSTDTLQAPTALTRPRTDARVTPITDGVDAVGWVVAGTEDLDEAVLLVVRLMVAADEHWTFDDTATIAPKLIRHGWFRWNPCHPRSCYDHVQHTGHIDYVEGPGRGNFRAFYFE